MLEIILDTETTGLSITEKHKSKIIFETLKLGIKLISNGEKNVMNIYKYLNSHLKSEPDIIIDYLKIINYHSLLEFTDVINDDYAICIAIYINQIRLIDNMNYLSIELSSI